MRLDPEKVRRAANAAVEARVESGMIVGLGSGSTASQAVRRIGELLSEGELQDIKGIPTSETTAQIAREVGIPILELSEARPEVTIDGADEIDPNLALIKGRGGALLREKIVTAASDTLVIVADDSKIVDALGRDALPVEVEPFGWESTLEALAALGCEPTRRHMDGDPNRPFVTDGGHYTVDCVFPAIENPDALEAEIRNIPGALECGLFVSLAQAAFIAGADGTSVMEPGI